MINDESDNDGSDSGYAGTCAFPFHFEDSIGRVDDSVGHVRGMDSGIFVSIGIEYNFEVVLLVMFVPI